MSTTITDMMGRGSRRLAVPLVAAALAVMATGCVFAGEIVAYDLPADAARYTLELDTEEVQTTWEYTSSRPVDDETPEGTRCFEAGPDAPACRAEPLIFLRYDLGLDLDNTMPAQRARQVTITSYYQEPSPSRLVTELGLEVSFDGGDTWERVATRPRGGGAFAATIRNPRLEATSGVVGLRVEAADSEGNTVRQTVQHAYRLASR